MIPRLQQYLEKVAMHKATITLQEVACLQWCLTQHGFTKVSLCVLLIRHLLAYSFSKVTPNQVRLDTGAIEKNI